MIKIDLDYAKFFYSLVMLGAIGIDEMGMMEFGYPEGSGLSYFDND